MSYASNLIACSEVQTRLANVFNYNNLAERNTPLLAVLLSERNRQGVLMRDVSPGGGKIRAVQVIYEQRFLESIVQQGGRVRCQGGVKSGELSKIYELTPDDGNTLNWSIEARDLEARCEADADYIARQLEKAMDVLLQKSEAYVAMQIALNFGNFASDVTNGNPPGTTTVAQGYARKNGVLDYDLSSVIRYEFAENEYNGDIIAFGGADTLKYMAQLAASTAENPFGVQPETFRMNANIYYGYSRQMAAAMGGQQYIAGIMPGAVQIFAHNEFKDSNGNPRVIEQPTLTQGTIQHPLLPIEMDYYAEYKCEGTERVWNFGLAWNFDTAFLPNDLFAIGDRMEGTNGLLKFEALNT